MVWYIRDTDYIRLEKRILREGLFAVPTATQSVVRKPLTSKDRNIPLYLE